MRLAAERRLTMDRWPRAAILAGNPTRRENELGARTVGPYEILQKLGSGGMGEVYLAQDTRLRRLVALKTVTPARSGPDGHRRLLKEARAAATLTHPNIAAVYDVVESDGEAHIVMEYVRGETLSQRVRRGPLPAAAALEIGIQLCDALAAAHAAGVVHRDLKCDNVVVGAEGRAKILDFGLAKVHDAGRTSSTDAGASDVRELRGTPPYMSPEQFLGEPVDGRTDLYSLGVVLYELLTGRRPFQGADNAALARAVLSGTCVPACAANPAVPVELSGVVAKAMERSRSRRYQSADHLRTDLRRLSVLVTAQPTLSRRWPRPRLGLPGRSSLAGALAVLGLAGTVAHRSGTSSARTPPGGPTAVAVLPLANVSGDASKDHLGLGMAHLLANGLSRLPGLTVISASAALPYADRKLPMKRIGADLGATFIVDGVLQRASDPMLVTFSLVDPRSDTVVWGESYEFRSSDVSALPQRVAEGLAGALPTSLSTADRRRLLRPPTSDADALADYTQARGFLDRRDVPGNLHRSVALFQSATRRDPTFALAHAGLGEAYWALYDVTRERAWTVKARDAIAEALRLDPEQPGVHYSLALIYHGTGRPEEALDQVRQALILQPGGDDAHRLLARLLADQGRLEEAVAEARRAIDLRPGYWGGHSELGSLYLQWGRLPEAAAAFRRVTELQPDNAWGFQQLGTALHMSGDTEGALRNYERALRLMPDPKAWGNVGSIHYAQGRLRQAARAFEESARLDPNSPAAHRNLGDTYRRLGQEEKARQSYERAVRLVEEARRVNPRDARSLAMLAVYEAKLGRHEQARGHVREALALGSASAEVHYRAAVVHALGGRRVEALEALEQALRSGYSLVLAQGDEDLASLRSTQAYDALVATYGKHSVAGG